jgi:hypothetical protein
MSLRGRSSRSHPIITSHCLLGRDCFARNTPRHLRPWQVCTERTLPAPRPRIPELEFAGSRRDDLEHPRGIGAPPIREYGRARTQCIPGITYVHAPVYQGDLYGHSIGIREERARRSGWRFAKMDGRFARSFRAEYNLKQRTASVRWRMVDLSHSIINRADGIIEGILGDEIGREEPAVVQFYDFQYVCIKGQVYLESNEICDILSRDGRPRRMIYLKRQYRWLNRDNRSGWRAGCSEDQHGRYSNPPNSLPQSIT